MVALEVELPDYPVDPVSALQIVAERLVPRGGDALAPEFRRESAAAGYLYVLTLRPR